MHDLPPQPELRESLTPEQQARLRSFVRLYKEHWRPHISLAGPLTPTDRSRVKQIAHRLLQAYAFFDDKEAGALAAETNALLAISAE